MPLKFNEIFPDDLKCQELCVDIYIHTQTPGKMDR